MNPFRRNLIRGTKGQSLIEFALILPMMLVVMFMITEFGRALYTYNVLATAAREGARLAVIKSASTASSAGTARMNSILTAANMASGSTVTVAVDNDYKGTGTKVVVATVTRPFTWAMSGPITMNGGATVSKSVLTLKGESVMKTETF